jgi:hypothetical protein
MAVDAGTGWSPYGKEILVGFILFFVVLIVYSTLVKRKRKKLIKSLKSGGTPVAGGPIFIQGAADDPPLTLPSTKEKCAFYAVHVFSKESAFKSKLGSTEVHGFDVIDMSGDFSVNKDGKKYIVGISDYYERMKPLVGAIIDFEVKMMLGRYGTTVQDYISEKKFAPAIKSVLMVVFGMKDYESKSGSSTSMPFYRNISTKIKFQKLDSTIDTAIREYTFGKDVPEGIMKILRDKKVIQTSLVNDGDGMYVIEAYIPLGKPIYVVGTYTTKNGKDVILMKDNVTSLTVSYKDPETIT